jgi:predicted transcriptional regulator
MAPNDSNEGYVRRRKEHFSTVPHALICDPDMSAWAVRVYAYLDMRAGKNDNSWPGIEKIAEEMGASESTIRRALKDLVEANWIMRERRPNTSSITYIYDNQEACRADAESNGQFTGERSDQSENSGQFTGEPTGQFTGERITISRENNKQIKRHEMTDEEYQDSMTSLLDLTDEERAKIAAENPVVSSLPLDEWPYWLDEIIPRNKALIQKAKTTPLEDQSTVQHFGSEEVRRVIATFHRLWNVPIPSKAKFNESAVKDWSKSALQIIEMCGDHDVVKVLEAYKKFRDEREARTGEIDTVTRPGSITRLLAGFVAHYVPVEQKQMFDDEGVPIFYA